MNNVQIDPSRLLSDLRSLADIGRVGTGVRRTAYSPHDLNAREWLSERMSAAGLEVTIDNVGNVIGRTSRASRALLIGSHTDTVPTGGWLDGSLGVIYGLEVARVLLEAHALEEIGIDVVSFADEEGTFSGWFGSRTFCGDMDAVDLTQIYDQDGKSTLAEVLTPLAGRARQRLDRTRYIGYIEAHIEQGPRLEGLGKPIGVVTSIVGIRNHKVGFSGAADHAGTTPMTMRKDAGQRLFRFVTRLVARFAEMASPETVWNIGNVIMQPGAQNVVPARAEFLLQYRDPTSERLKTLDKILEEEVARANEIEPDTCSFTTSMVTEPVSMHPDIQQVIRKAAEAEGAAYEMMASGAGHDAAAMAKHLPTGMIFVPSIGGRSHTFEEDTTEGDIIAGAKVMLRSAEMLVGAARTKVVAD